MDTAAAKSPQNGVALGNRSANAEVALESKRVDVYAGSALGAISLRNRRGASRTVGAKEQSP